MNIAGILLAIVWFGFLAFGMFGFVVVMLGRQSSSINVGSDNTKEHKIDDTFEQGDIL